MIEIILIEPRKQENIGSVARAMKNFSFDNLVLINPKCKIGVKAHKVAKHGKDILKKTKIKDFSYLNKMDYLVGTTAILGTDYNIPRNSITAEQLAVKISKINYKIHENRRFSGSSKIVNFRETGNAKHFQVHRKSRGFSREIKIGILIGREGSGLNNKEINLCDILVTIPASRKYPTFNVSHALIIILYEIFKKLSIDKSNSHINFASKKEKDIILKYIAQILNKMEFATKEKKDTQKNVWKRVFGKALLTKREAFVVMGFLRKFKK